MSRLIIMSNRVSAPSGKSDGAQGGLAVALTAALREHDGIWFGWSGETSDDHDVKIATFDGVTSATVDLTEQDVDEYYNGYANRTLWPLFHFRLGLTEFDRDFQGGYERVNRAFAQKFAPHLNDDDLIWVHDYHLIPLGWLLRQQGFANRIGFFLHIPWPPTNLMTTLPDHGRLVESMFAYDVVSFQTEESVESFVHYVTTQMHGTFDGKDKLTVNNKTICVFACPIGIDATEFIVAANGPVAAETCARVVESGVGRSLIVGVDRLDYSKGLEERFAGYERYLHNHPEQRKHVFLLQIAPPSRVDVDSYQQIRASLNSLSGRINGEYADVDWVPIRYVNQGYPRDQLAGVYRAARIGLVTPLRDGMNLVAKEFVAAQDPEDPGVLILSRFAGAASQLDRALLINPYSADEISEAIETALAMSREERIARWRPMFEKLCENDVIWWRKSFMEALAGEGTGCQADC